MITLRGVDLNSGGLDLHLISGYSEHPSVKGEDAEVPYRPGRITGSRVADVRKLVLDGFVSGETPEEWRDATDILMAICDPTLSPGPLVITEPYLGITGFATINVRVLNAVGGPILMGKLYQRWSIELESIDPFWNIGGGSGS